MVRVRPGRCERWYSERHNALTRMARDHWTCDPQRVALRYPESDEQAGRIMPQAPGAAGGVDFSDLEKIAEQPDSRGLRPLIRFGACRLV